jgi:holo-[acyl-carrier protein] synthase
VIYGIGTDIVSVPRMAENLKRHGDRFAERILTPQELQEFRRAGKPAHFLAKRFAAKEAAAKALGTGFSEGLFLSHIGVGHDPRGRPILVFSGRGAELMDLFGIGEAHLSLSDEKDLAIAFVTLVRRV